MATRLARTTLSLAALLATACPGNVQPGGTDDGGFGLGDGGKRPGDGPMSLGDGSGGGDGSSGDGPVGPCGTVQDQFGCACPTPGATRACYTGPAGTENVGLCKDGSQMCTGQGEFYTWTPCTGDVTPAQEVCSDQLDHNCNGLTGCDDPACAGVTGCCSPGQTRPCYDGPAGTDGVGQCAAGTQKCNAMGAWPQACTGEVTPGTEAGHCHDGIDNDCNARVDCMDPACANDPGCQPVACQPGTTQGCYDGPPVTDGVGQCKSGTQTCNAQGQWVAVCNGEVLPGTEANHCHDGIDNDCNGRTDCKDPACVNDPGCQPMACQPGTTQACYDGPPGTDGVGRCRSGTQTCNAQGQWPATCSGEVLPISEIVNCHDGIDNDCDGATDCQDIACALDPGCQPMVCNPGATMYCYDGPGGTDGVGQCHGGTQTCLNNGSGWGGCNGEVLPGDETNNCSDGIDNDCDGNTDCNDPYCYTSPDCCVPIPPIDSTIYATSATTLYIIDPSGTFETAVGNYGVADNMTDIGMTVDGYLYTVSSTSLYSVDTFSAAATWVTDLPNSLNNSLTFLPDGTLLGADAGGDLVQIDPVWGTVTYIGNYGRGLGSSGDLVAVADGTMYGVSATNVGGGSAVNNNLLITVDTNTGAASVVGPIGFANVFGLAYYGGRVYGFDNVGDILEIDPATGRGTRLSNQGHHYFGGTTSPLMPGNGCP